MTIKIDASDLGEQFGTLDKVGASLTVGAILAGALIGMSIVTVVLIQAPNVAQLGPIPGFASPSSSGCSSTLSSRCASSSASRASPTMTTNDDDPDAQVDPCPRPAPGSQGGPTHSAFGMVTHAVGQPTWGAMSVRHPPPGA